MIGRVIDYCKSGVKIRKEDNKESWVIFNVNHVLPVYEKTNNAGIQEQEILLKQYPIIKD